MSLAIHDLNKIYDIGQTGRVGEMGSLVPSLVKPITYKIDTCHFLAWLSVLSAEGKDWVALWQDNVTECDIASWPDFPVVQH